MKIIVFAILIALGFCKHLRRQQSDKIVDIITKYGYEVESSTVTTEDGYILKLFRIPPKTDSHSESKENSKGAVLLFHGLMSSAEDFVYGGPNQGLAFYLSDLGYDVYLGNSRGSVYGLQHTTLNPTTDAVFWKFCFNDVGVKDLPAIIQKIGSISQEEQISFVGHMEGATAAYVLLSQKPEYNAYIDKLISLGPIAFVKKATHPFLELILKNHRSDTWLIKHLGKSTFNPSSELVEEVESKCSSVQEDQKICQNLYFLFNGFNSNQFNQTIVKQAIQRVPFGTSVRQILHLAELKDTGRFQTFGDQPEDYDLNKISTPVAIFYTPRDCFSHVDDVEFLAKKLPKVYKKQLLNDYTNNLDLIYGKNVVDINKDIADALKQQINEVFV